MSWTVGPHLIGVYLSMRECLAHSMCGVRRYCQGSRWQVSQSSCCPDQGGYGDESGLGQSHWSAICGSTQVHLLTYKVCTNMTSLLENRPWVGRADRYCVVKEGPPCVDDGFPHIQPRSSYWSASATPRKRCEVASRILDLTGASRQDFLLCL